MRQAGPSVVDITSLPEEIRNDLYIQIAALAALINEPKLKKTFWVKENVKSQLIDTQHRCYKGNIWKKIAKKEIGLASLGNIASLLTSRDNVSLELTTSSKLR